PRRHEAWWRCCRGGRAGSGGVLTGVAVRLGGEACKRFGGTVALWQWGWECRRTRGGVAWPQDMEHDARFCRKVRFLGKIQKSGVRNSITCRLPNSRKSNFATEPIVGRFIVEIDGDSAV